MPRLLLMNIILILLAPSLVYGQPTTNQLPPDEKKLLDRVRDISMEGWGFAEEDKYDEAIAKANIALRLIEKSQYQDQLEIWFSKHESLVDLGTYYYAKGEYQLAEEYLLKAKKLREDRDQKEGFSGPSDFLEPARLALVYQALGKSSLALDNFVKSDQIRGYSLSGVFNLFDERARIQDLQAALPSTNWIISFSIQEGKKNPEAAGLAFLSALRRKSRLASSMAYLFQILRQRDLEKKEQSHVLAMNQYFEANKLLSDFYLRNDPKTAQTQYSQLEAQYRKTSEKFDELFSTKNIGELLSLFPDSKGETLHDIQDALPADSALIEFVVYAPFNFTARENSKRWGEPHYAAFVVHPQNGISVTDLGTVAEIDEALINFRAALSYPSGDIKELARAIDRILMAPLRGLLNNKLTVFIAPDGQLNLVPFGALVDEKNSYLIETYSFRYLTSARDLLSLNKQSQDKTSQPDAANQKQETIPKRQGPVLVGDPSFFNETSNSLPIQTCAQLAASSRLVEEKKTARDKGTRSNRAQERSRSTAPVSSGSEQADATRLIGQFNFQFVPIPFSRTEVANICNSLPEAKLLVGPNATEENLKSVTGPVVLHIATHGYFIADTLPAEEWIDGRFHYRLRRNPWGDIRFDIHPPEDPTLLENPLLRSGLALAGANNLVSAGGQDGIITALEMMGLDLRGTKLVVLSACHTGVGDVKDGEGVFGLRRALLIAGAESQLISLWSVEDQGTSTLMTEYYRRLSQGEGRAAALQNAQLTMLRDKDRERQHPYYWAGFIQSGAWTKID